MTDRKITEITDPRAILAAVDEYNTLGREAFLEKHGFGRAREYYLEHNGKRYDSKAIVGVAFGYQHKTRPLRPDEFSGGERTVERQLNFLGFSVRRRQDT